MEGTQFTIRRKVLTLLGAKFHVYNAEGKLLGFCHQKAFKLKEDIRFYTDETMTDERLIIQARKMLDISAAYDVIDGKTGNSVGMLQRQGLKSLFRDEWHVFDEDGGQVGIIREDSAWMALVRRLFENLIPQNFHLDDTTGQKIAEFKTHFNPFVHRMTVTIGHECPCNPMLIIAAGILLVAVEGRQK
ncbi:MAG: hypothetical protein AB7O26_11395 [Planctomycetaceae bacterium]